MSDFAVIKLQGRQYLVNEGEELVVDKLTDPKKIEASVLLVSKSGKVTVGTPEVKGASVKLKLVEEKVLGDKVKIFKYKSKSRFRKRMGFRPQYSTLKVEKIS